MSYSVTVAPTAYTTYSAVPQYKTERTCNQKSGKCRDIKVFVGWKCVASTTYFRESLSSPQTSASLSQDSRVWIESGDLQIHYPGAYLHHPD